MAHPSITDTHALIFESTGKPYMSSLYDNLFKAVVTAGWCVKSDGHVEAPTGYFSMTEIPSHPGELREMQDAVEDKRVPFSTWPPAGWYITVEDSAGFMYVYPTNGETQAGVLFHKVLDIFSRWDNE